MVLTPSAAKALDPLLPHVIRVDGGGRRQSELAPLLLLFSVLSLPPGGRKGDSWPQQAWVGMSLFLVPSRVNVLGLF